MLRLQNLLSGARNRTTSKEPQLDHIRPSSSTNLLAGNGSAWTESTDSQKEAFPKVVHLNVGGHKYMTTLMTIRGRMDTRLADMFSGLEPVHRDADGYFCIDREGSCFHHILNFLRDGSVPIGLSHIQRLNLLRETKYYRIDSLHAILGGVQEPHLQTHHLHGSRAKNRGSTRMKSDMEQAAEKEELDFVPNERKVRIYARLRHGHEYPGDWIVSSPRNLPNVKYEAHEAMLSRDLIPAINKMQAAGFKSCTMPPALPDVSDYHREGWQIMMYRDVPISGASFGRQVQNLALGCAVRQATSSSASMTSCSMSRQSTSTAVL